MDNKQKGFVALLLIAFIALLAIGGGFHSYLNKKPTNYLTPKVSDAVDSVVTSTVANTVNNNIDIATSTNQTEVNNNQNLFVESTTTNNQKFDLNYLSYVYGVYKDKVLFYEPDGRYYVNVYILDRYTKTEIIHHAPVEIRGGPQSMPYFEKTASSSIIKLLGVATATDWSSSYIYYINIDSGKVLIVKQLPDYIKITDFSGSTSTIMSSVIDDCDIGKDAVFNDININGKPQNVINQSYLLKCNNDYLSEGIGGVPYEPYPEIHYSGMSSDLSKIFFYVKIANYSGDGAEDVILRKDFSYDLISKITKEESYSPVVLPTPKDVGKIAISIQNGLWESDIVSIYIDGKREGWASMNNDFLSRDLPVGQHWVQVIDDHHLCKTSPEGGGNYTVIKDKTINMSFILNSCVRG